MTKIIKYAVIPLVCTLSASAAAPTLCSTAEVNVFSCGAGKKIISVCASKEASADQGYIQYRFGAPQKVELTVPASKSVPPAKSAIAGNLSFSGGGGAYLRFPTGDYEYIVYTAIGKGWGEKDGVAIEQKGKRRAHVSCTDEPVSKMGVDFFTKTGLSEDKGEFELP
jgi:hypothetical protein